MKPGKIKISELKNACEIIERYARTIGKNCEIIFTESGVQVAPLSWSGDITESNLFKALIEARKSSDNED